MGLLNTLVSIAQQGLDTIDPSGQSESGSKSSPPARPDHSVQQVIDLAVAIGTSVGVAPTTPPGKSISNEKRIPLSAHQRTAPFSNCKIGRYISCYR
jgi:hypothetical protein